MAAVLLAGACAQNGTPPSVPPKEEGKLVTYVTDFLYDAGRGSSVALDQDGNPTVSYLLLQPILKKGQIPPPIVAGQPLPPSVMLATFADKAWTRTAITGQPVPGDKAVGMAKDVSTNDGTVGPAVNTSLVVDGRGVHHVAWSSADGAYYAEDASGSFGDPEQFATGAPTLGYGLAVGASGTPWVAFYQGSKLEIASKSGTSWALETVASGVDPGGPPASDVAIGLTAAGDPVVAYGDRGRTVVARKSGAGWQTDQAPGDGGLGVSMALDKDGNAHVAYYDSSGGVHHAHRIGNAPWTVTDLATGQAKPDATWGTGIALDDQGTHYVTWRDPAKNDVQLANNSGGSFAAQSVPNSDGGATPSIAVSGDGKNLALSFFDTVNANLEVAVPADRGLTFAFSPPPTSAGPAATTPPAAACKPNGTSLVVRAPVGAAGTGFDTKCLAASAGKAFSVEFDNEDQNVHNWALYQEDPTANPSAKFLGGAPNLEPVAPGGSATYDVKAIDAAGTYFFRCDFHPTTMNGQFVVE
jgi:plastocyanin